MKAKFYTQNMIYDGSQLKSLYTYLNHEILGDSILSWIGPCNIPSENIVDGEDKLKNSKICADKMLHFIVEKFDCSLLAAVGLQRILVCLSKDLVTELSTKDLKQEPFVRKGDDLYFKDGKLNISIATQSPTSSMIHFAVNIVNDGTPVKTSCLKDFEIDPVSFADVLMSRFCLEVESMTRATQKVFSVR